MGGRGLELSFLLLWLVEASRRGLELRSSGFEMPAVMSPWYEPSSYSPFSTSVFSGIRGGGENSVGFGLKDKKVGSLPSKISCLGTILRLWEREMPSGMAMPNHYWGEPRSGSSESEPSVVL